MLAARKNNASFLLVIAIVAVLVLESEGQTAGLVAAYGFDEGSGPTVVDASGFGHSGTIVGATRTPSGRFNQALSFNGNSDSVTIADTAALDLSTAMTLEAWVYPTALSGWRTVILKEAAGGLAYALYAHDNAPRPATYINTGGSDVAAAGTATLTLNTWTYLAATYDGTTLWIFVNGTQVGSRAVSGSILSSAEPLRIGGNAIWGEYFQGVIDEVRIYNRVLSPAEIQTDMSTPISSVPDFSFAVSPSARTVGPNASTSFEVEVAYLNGFTSNQVDLWVTGLPPGVTGEYIPNPLPHQGRSGFALETSSSPTGTYTFTMGATAEGITHSQDVTLIVSDQPDFSIAVDPKTQNVSAEASTTYQVALTPSNGFASSVSLSVSGVPQGASSAFAPQSLIPPGTSTLTITTSTSTPTGQYPLTITATSGSLVHIVQASLLVTSSTAVWTVAPIGSTGVWNNSVRVGAARNDGVSRVYVGTISTGRVLEYSWNGSNWGSPINVGGSPTGSEIHNFGMGPGRNDGLIRIYAASLDRNIYEISYSGGTWTQSVVGTLDAEAMHAAVGIGRNDGINRVYAVSIQTAYEFTWNGAGWTRVVVGSVPGGHGIELGEGRNDSLTRLYIASISSGTYEAQYISGAWSLTSMGDSGDVRNVSLGVGRNDGVIRLYSALLNGQVRELSWDGNAWTFSPLTAPLGTYLIHAYALAGRNDGTNRVYASASNGNVYEFSWNGSSWSTYNMGGGTDYMYGLHFGPGRNDGVTRIYGTDRGTANQVYEYTWSAGSPDTTPPIISAVASSTGADGRATITWTTNESSNSRVDYGTDPSSLTLKATNPALVTAHSIILSGLAPNTTYYYRATSADAAANAATSPPMTAAPASFTTPASSISIADTSVTEGHTGTVSATFTVTLSAASAQTVTVSYATANGTATAGTDYVMTSGTLTFAPGTTSQPVTAEVTGDTVGEPDETFTATLSNPTNAVIARAQAIGMIINDDGGVGSAGLVAAYGFNETSGPTVADATGNGHTGTISGAIRTVAGRYGSALSFDGVNDWVTVNDSPTLDLTRMTLTAWVRPTALSGWRTAILKETAGGLAYALYAHDDAPRPAGYVKVGGVDLPAIGTSALPLNTWTHLATTYDGTTLRLFVDGVQVGSRAVTGNIAVSARPLQFGGNSVWGEYFSGQIDEIRIYNRALNQAEIQSDMNTPLP